MRIAYYVPATMLRHEGIRRRAAATAQVWREQGHHVTEVAPALAPPEPAGVLTLARWQHACDARASAELATMAVEDRLDHVHLRLFVPTSGWARLAQRLPVSLEVHALPGLPESSRDLYRVLASWLPSRRLADRASGAVFVTADLAARFGHGRVPRLAIGNGVLLGDVLPAPRNPRPRLVLAVASRGGWHGLDRLDVLARLVPEASWAVVTPAALGDWTRGALGPGSPVEVVATRTRDDYDAQLAGADATMGTLALDRRRLREAAPLKVRDSVAAGIPVVLPYADTNLAAADDPAVLRVDARHSAATAAAVRAWLPGVIGARVSEATRSLVDLRTIERRRADFLAGLTRKGSGSPL